MNEIKESEITVDDFKKICRVCLKIGEDMVDIFRVGIHTQIMEVTNLKIEVNDKLPNVICQKCKLQLESLTEFIQQAKSSDFYLRSLLSIAEEDAHNQLTEEEKEEKYIGKKSPRKKLKKWSRRSKGKKSRGGETESDKMYLIFVPKTDDCDSKVDMDICIKDLNSDNDNLELTHYCRSLVNNHFSDHTYPKERRNLMECKLDDGFSEAEESRTYPVNLDIYECRECKMAFEEINDLKSHFSMHDSQSLPERDYCFTCPVCATAERDKSIFMAHLKSHREEGFIFVKVNLNGRSAVIHENEDVFTPLKDARNCRVFMLNLTTIFCSVCFSNVESSNISEHVKSCTLTDVEFSIKHSCPVCFNLFIDDEENFIKHLADHKKEDFYFVKIGDAVQPIEPDTNEDVYVSFEEASRITKIIQENSCKILKVEDVNSCDKCDYVAECFGRLCEHYDSIHAEKLSEITFHCPVCLEILCVTDENQEKLYEHLRAHRQEGVVFILAKRSGSMGDIKEEYSDIFTQSTVLWNLMDLSAISREVYSPELMISGLKSEKYTCDFCQREFYKKKDVISHLKSHQGESGLENGNYICERCGKKCSGKGNYKKHFLQHSKGLGSVGRRPTCTICNKTFANRVTLNGHMRHHLKEGSGNDFESLIGIICEKCGKGFSNNASLTKHKKLHLRDKENAILKCEICDRDFFRQSSFDRHKSAHLNPKYFECDICKLPLSSVSSLQKHLETHRNGSNTFDCKACKLSFLTKDSLTAHQTHTGHYLDRKPLECNVCHEKFFIGRKFTEHIKTHPKYKMGECTLCGKRLSTIQSLMLHMGRHFESNSILCPHCGKQFFEERNYHRHLLTHEGIRPFPCDVEDCKKSFYTLFELNRHKKYHNNTRDFRCPYCSKSFHEANHLTVHVRTHTGERPYTCPHCSKGFVTRTRCKHHIKLVHQGVGYDLIQSSISKKVTVFEAVEAIV